MVEIRRRCRVPFDPSRVDQVFAIDFDTLAYNDRFECVPIRFRVKIEWHKFSPGDGADRSDRCNWAATIEAFGRHYHFDCGFWQRDYAWMYLSHFSLDDCVLSLKNDDGVDYLNSFAMNLEIALVDSDEGSYFDIGYILYQKLPLCRTVAM